MNYTFGLIGTGNMGGAVARAVSQVIKDGILANRTLEKAQALARDLGFQAGSNAEVARNSRYLFLGVKPHLMGEVLAEVRPVLEARQEAPVLVSMAAGLTIAQIQAMAGHPYPVIRIMPNTPVAVGQGVVLYETSKEVSSQQREEFLTLLAQAGALYPLQESLMDVGAAVAGCGPAFVYLALDAMADGGVACGLSLRPSWTQSSPLAAKTPLWASDQKNNTRVQCLRQGPLFFGEKGEKEHRGSAPGSHRGR